MTEATPTLFPWGNSDDVRKLVARGRSRGMVTMDEVVLALRNEELTTEVIEGVRELLASEGIAIDESVPSVDDLDHLHPGDAPPPSVEAELHEARDAAYAARDFEEDGPELGGVRPGSIGRGAPPRAARGVVSGPQHGGHVGPRPHVPQGDRPGPAAHGGRGGRVLAAGRVGRVRRHAPRRPGGLGPARPPRVRGAAGAAARRAPGRGRPRGADRGEPAPRRVDREALRRPGHALPRPDPGGEPRPHAGRGEVRLHEGLQVLHLRHLVDPPGHHPCDRRPGPHDPDPGAHGRVDQQGPPGAAPDAPGPRARAHGRGAGRGRRASARTASARSTASASTSCR